MPTVCIKTVGCRLNQAETAQLAAQFEAAGYRVVEGLQPCDVAVVNTCTITHGAERDSAKWARRLRREGARIVVLAGCAVEHNADGLKEDSGADLVVGQSDKTKLLERLHGTGGLDPRPELLSADLPHPDTPLFSATRALVKAQDGCNFRCSYCIVPDTRGEPASIPLPEVIRNIEQLAGRGYREVVITGANLGCYSDGEQSLISLLEEVEKVSGIDRIRISSIESTTIEREIIDFMASSAKLCHFLHLPLQSGDDAVLRRMGRRYTRDRFRSVVEYAVERLPDLGLGTDIIVGFPGETDAEFENTIAFIDSLPFSNLHVFSYSPRRGTPAAEMNHQVDPKVKRDRSARLIALGKTKRETFASSFSGRPVTALIERIDDNGAASGWTDQYLPVRITAGVREINTIITFIPSHSEGDVLVGENNE